jgi:hypothetical protein
MTPLDPASAIAPTQLLWLGRSHALNLAALGA